MCAVCTHSIINEMAGLISISEYALSFVLFIICVSSSPLIFAYVCVLSFVLKWKLEKLQCFSVVKVSELTLINSCWLNRSIKFLNKKKYTDHRRIESLTAKF